MLTNDGSYGLRNMLGTRLFLAVSRTNVWDEHRVSGAVMVVLRHDTGDGGTHSHDVQSRACVCVCRLCAQVYDVPDGYRWASLDDVLMEAPYDSSELPAYGTGTGVLPGRF